MHESNAAMYIRHNIMYISMHVERRYAKKTKKR